MIKLVRSVGHDGGLQAERCAAGIKQHVAAVAAITVWADRACKLVTASSIAGRNKVMADRLAPAIFIFGALALGGCQERAAPEPSPSRVKAVHVAVGPSVDLEAETQSLRTRLSDVETRMRATDARMTELVRAVGGLRDDYREQQVKRDEADRIERRLSEMETRLGI